MRRQGEWNGVVSDLGGPTANMYQMRCEDEKYRVQVPASLVRAPGASAST